MQALPALALLLASTKAAETRTIPPDLYWRSEPPKEDDEVYANSFRPWLPNPLARVELFE